MKFLETGDMLATAAAKAGLDQKTASKWSQSGQFPSEAKEPWSYRTRLDAFAEDWPEIEQLLERDAAIEAKTIFDHLCRQHQGKFQEGQLRTLQRKVKVWRALKGQPREVFFPQVHLPGHQGQSDFTYMNDLRIMIAGQVFKHLAYHFTLTYSNWERAMICGSEWWESLAEGLQRALWESSGTPELSSAAIHSRWLSNRSAAGRNGPNAIEGCCDIMGCARATHRPAAVARTGTLSRRIIDSSEE